MNVRYGLCYKYCKRCSSLSRRSISNVQFYRNISFFPIWLYFQISTVPIRSFFVNLNVVGKLKQSVRFNFNNRHKKKSETFVDFPFWTRIKEVKRSRDSIANHPKTLSLLLRRLCQFPKPRRFYFSLPPQNFPENSTQLNCYYRSKGNLYSDHFTCLFPLHISKCWHIPTVCVYT